VLGSYPHGRRLALASPPSLVLLLRSALLPTEGGLCIFSVILPARPRRLRVAVLFPAALFLLYHAGLVGSAGTRSPGHSTTGGGPARPSSLPSDEPTMNQDPLRGVSLLLLVIDPGRHPSDAGEYAETEGWGRGPVGSGVRRPRPARTLPGSDQSAMNRCERLVHAQ
jgi:hypothetical protein